jgi:hypothetical protein
MTEPRTRREFKERLLDNFDRSRLRREVRRVRGARYKRLRNRYASMVVGASMAVGGLAIPMKSSRMLESLNASDVHKEISAITDTVEGSLAPGFLTNAIRPEQLVENSQQTVQELEIVTQAVKEDFFKAEIPFGSIIYREAVKNDLDPHLVAAVVETESQFKPNARSPVGAQGLMQLMPRTGRWMGAKNLLNPTDNVQAGTKYLKYLNERFDGDETMVLAAYNAGEGNVRRYGGIPPFKETRNYVKKVKASKAELDDRVAGKVAETVANPQAAAAAAAALTPAR